MFVPHPVEEDGYHLRICRTTKGAIAATLPITGCIANQDGYAKKFMTHPVLFRNFVCCRMTEEGPKIYAKCVTLRPHNTGKKSEYYAKPPERAIERQRN